MSPLSTRKCAPCAAGTTPLRGEALMSLLRELKGWEAVDQHHLAKQFTFPNFVTALAFVNNVGELAEQEGHHPDIFLAWGKVRIETWTHSIGGLSENDFVLAAKIDELPR